jgi:tetratricopeptide (TPR) repeat protein
MKNSNLEEALGWAKRAVTGQPFSQAIIDNYKNLALGYEKLNRLPQADSVMNVGLTIADINDYISYVRTLIGQKRNDRSIEVMLGARAKFGDVYSVNNWLAYAYSGKADYKKAIEFANKALLQAPNEQAKTTISGNIKKLKEEKDINQ